MTYVADSYPKLYLGFPYFQLNDMCQKMNKVCIILQSDIQPHMLLNQTKWLIMPIYITSRISHLWLQSKKGLDNLTRS